MTIWQAMIEIKVHSNRASNSFAADWTRRGGRVRRKQFNLVAPDNWRMLLT